MTEDVTVYRYGLRAPLDWDTSCEDELRRMSELWNALVTIGNTNRAEVMTLTAADPSVVAHEAERAVLVAALEALREERRASNKANRGRVKRPDLDARAAALRPQLATVNKVASEARRAARARNNDKMTAITRNHYEAVKGARNAAYLGHKLYWGNYNAVCQSYERARSRTLKGGGTLKSHRHYDCPEAGMSRARLVNQIQGGATAAELIASGCSQVALDPERRLLRLTVYRHDRARQATWPIVYDRPLPDEARIQEVSIHRRAVADSWEWSVSFLLRVPAKLPAAADERSCGIDLGWRLVNSGLRVATVVHDGGDHEHIVLPPIFQRRMERIEALDSERIKSADAVRVAMRALDWTKAPAELCPLSMRALRTKRAEDLHVLVVAWRRHPAWGGEAFQIANTWRAQDRKDWQERAGLARRIANARQDFYRCTVKRLTERYGVIGIENINWATIGEREKADGTPNDIAIATGRYRRLASPGAFVAELTRAARNSGSHIHRHAGPSTWECNDCGVVSVPADRSELIHACPACQSVWDQDVNAARNLRAAAMASGSVPPDDAGALADDVESGNNDMGKAA